MRITRKVRYFVLYLKRKVMEKRFMSVYYDGTDSQWEQITRLFKRIQARHPLWEVLIFDVPFTDRLIRDVAEITEEQKTKLTDCYFRVHTEGEYIIGKFIHKSLFKAWKGDKVFYNLAKEE